MEEKLIKILIDKVLDFDFDELLELTASMAEIKTEDENYKLTWMDKFAVNKHLWKITLERLYKTYLPAEAYTFNWKIELTPYTLLLTRFIPEPELANKAMEGYSSSTGLTGQPLLASISEMLLALDIVPSGFSAATQAALPGETEKLYALLMRLMNFPPLGELATFYGKVQINYTRSLEALHEVFAGKKIDLPGLRVIEPYHLSIFPVSHQLYSDRGLEFFKNHMDLRVHHATLENIGHRAIEMNDNVTGKVICSCCGEENPISVGVQVMEYKLLVNNRKLIEDIGFMLLDQIEKEYKDRLIKQFYQLVDNLNPKEMMPLWILVEGDSEEHGLPLLALKRKLNLGERGIKIFNCGSKDRVSSTFESIKTKFPEIKMIALLDSDAKKEKADLERMMKNHRHLYDIVFIEQGTWEDLFPRERAVEVLNALYPEGEPILLSDLEPGKEFLKAISKPLWEKKKAGLNKANFSKSICASLEPEEVPAVVGKLFDIAEKLRPAEKRIFTTSTSTP